MFIGCGLCQGNKILKNWPPGTEHAIWYSDSAGGAEELYSLGSVWLLVLQLLGRSTGKVLPIATHFPLLSSHTELSLCLS